MTEKRATLLLVIVTFFWGTSYLFMQVGLDTIQPITMIALRFLVAFAAILPVLIKRRHEITRPLIIYSLQLGIVLFLVFVCIAYGLKNTTATNAAFLLALTVCLVPLAESLLSKKFPRIRIIIGVTMAVVGIGFLTHNGSVSMGFGDIICIFGAFLYAGHIIITDRAVKHVDGFLVGSWQLGVIAVIAFICALIFEAPLVMPQSGGELVNILILGILCGTLGFVAQPVAQKHVSPVRTGLIFSLEPLFSAICNGIFLHEVMTPYGYLGGVLMLAGIFVAEWQGKSVYNMPVAKNMVIEN